VHSDHLNTPCRLTDTTGQVVWQWAYSAFGDEKPTIAKSRALQPDSFLNSHAKATCAPAAKAECSGGLC